MHRRAVLVPMRLLLRQNGSWHRCPCPWSALKGPLLPDPLTQRLQGTKSRERTAAFATISQGGGKPKVEYVCTECGEKYIKWTGKCRACGAWDTLSKKTTVTKPKGGGGGGAGALAVAGLTGMDGPAARPETQMSNTWQLPQRSEWLQGSGSAVSLKNIGEEQTSAAWRLPLHGDTGEEVARVLGGGVVPGSLILVGGDPGIGKSTLLLQVAALLAHPGNGADGNGATKGQGPGQISPSQRVLYVSAEESADQIYNRSQRLEVGSLENLFVMTATQLEVILTEVAQMHPTAVILDSIQTVYLGSATGSAGSISQVRECGTALCHIAKAIGVPIFIVGHVTKRGDIAGPKMLEHVVDVVLYLEGERHQFYRVLRGMKNRYGPTDEIGVFRMDGTGLHVVPNPSAMFLRDRRADVPGVSSAVAVLVEGSRPLMLEVQALCTRVASGQEYPQRVSGGVLHNRLSLVIAVLTKHVRLKVHLVNLHINVIGGLLMKEPAGDVAIAVAIASSYFDQTVAADVAVVGELGLGGELRPVIHLDKRLVEVAKLGFRRCIVPASNSPGGHDRIPEIKGLTIVPCDTINEALRAVLGEQTLKKRTDYGTGVKFRRAGVPVNWDGGSADGVTEEPKQDV